MRTLTMLALSVAVLAAPGCKKSTTVKGEGDQKLTLKAPSAVTIERGGTARSDIEVSRNGATGDVSVTFHDLPKGVDVVDSSNRITGEKATYTLRASDTADLVERSSARVTATASGGIAATQSFDVTVKERK